MRTVGCTYKTVELTMMQIYGPASGDDTALWASYNASAVAGLSHDHAEEK